MLGYRKSTGDYIEVQEGTPVNASLIPVALRPTVGHIFADTWATDPLNAAVCWRLRTVPEQQTVQDAELQAFLGSAGGKALKALATVLIQKGLLTLADIKAAYRALP